VAYNVTSVTSCKLYQINKMHSGQGQDYSQRGTSLLCE